MPINLSKFLKGFKVQGPDDLAVMVGSDDQAIPAPKQTTEKKERRPHQSITIFGELDEGKDRKAAYRDFRIMDYTVPEFSRALTVISTVATAGDREVAEGFRLEFADDFPEDDRRIIEDLINRRLHLKDKIFGIIRSANKFGDLFKELVIDKQGLIWKLKTLEPELTDRVHDEYDRHEGFVYKGFEKEEQWLEWWQVIHLRHDKEDGADYGRSLFAGGGRELASRIIALRDGLTYETLNHATARNALILARPARWTSEQVDAWLDDVHDRIAREHVVDSEGRLTRRAITLLNGQDVVLDYPVDIEGKGVAPVVAPLKNAPIVDARNIAEHFQDILFVITGVPKAFMGIERHREGLGSGRLDKQDKQFTRQVFRDQLDAGFFVEEVIRRQFILLKRPLVEEGFSIVFPSLRFEDKKLKAEIMKLRFESAKMAVELNLPMSFVWAEVIFDGREAEASDAAELFGINFDTVDAENKAAANPPPPAGTPGSQPPKAKPVTTKKQDEQLNALIEQVESLNGRMLDLAPAKVSNRGVSNKDFPSDDQ